MFVVSRWLFCFEHRNSCAAKQLRPNGANVPNLVVLRLTYINANLVRPPVEVGREGADLCCQLLVCAMATLAICPPHHYGQHAKVCHL